MRQREQPRYCVLLSNPHIVVASQQKYVFIEFITALFSTLGFWLGVSVFESVFDVKILVCQRNDLHSEARLESEEIFDMKCEQHAPTQYSSHVTILKSVCHT